jgi:hypothetical protein
MAMALVGRGRNIHDDAWDGSLTRTNLQKYLQVDSRALQSHGGTKNVTPLAAAVWRGHLSTVKLLLANGADPDGPSPPNRTPLYYATINTPPKNRLAVIHVLLKAGADIDACSIEDGNRTPLHNAIVKLKDTEVVHTLVDNGASTTFEDTRGESAQTLAEESALEKELLSKTQRLLTKPEVINLLIAFMMLLLSIFGTKHLQDVVKSVVADVQETMGDNPTVRTYSHLR